MEKKEPKKNKKQKKNRYRGLKKDGVLNSLKQEISFLNYKGFSRF